MRFADFELDEPSARLLKHGVRVSVTPKAFAVLCLLVGKAPHLVTKDELLDAVWGHHHLSESVLKSVISELRSALDDDARSPRIVETVSRRGYRFIGLEVAPRAQAPSAAAPATGLPPAGGARLVGRAAEAAALHECWRQAQAGQRQIFWIAGEPGIGKSTLIDHFVSSLGNGALVARGQCVEQFGLGEPYMPVLEALGSVCVTHPDLVRTLRSVAPTWLMQMPWLIGDDERESLRRELSGVGQERMVREFGELLERYAAPQALLLVTEDLHWSDPSTLLLLNHVARRRAPARIMWLASFRVAEVIASDHPLQTLRHELKLHRYCHELVLNPFSERDLADYLQLRFAGRTPDEPLVKRLHSHTDGLPLFVVDVVEALTGPDPAEAHAPDLSAETADLPIPESLSALVGKRIGLLAPLDRAILQAASVCGVEINPVVVAAVTNTDGDMLAEALHRLASEGQWLRLMQGVAASSAPRYAFRHALYRHVFYQRASLPQRRQLHLRIAECLRGTETTATELAIHLELGGDRQGAARAGASAAFNALRHFAPLEAMELTAHALSLLERERGDGRTDAELAVLAPRAVAAAQLFGLSAPQTRHAFVRMQWLGRQQARRSGHVAELGLGWMYNLQGKYGRALTLADRVEQQARVGEDALLRAGACNLRGGTLALQGELVASATWLERGLQYFAPMADGIDVVPFVVDLGVSMHSRLGHVLTNLGRIARARAHAEAAMRRSEALRHPYARVLALIFTSIQAIRLEEPERVLTLTSELGSALEGQALTEGQGPLRWLRGWAVAKLGDPAAGCELIAEGRRMQDDLGRVGGGANAAIPLAVEALMLAGKLERAAAELAAGIAKTRRLGEGLHSLDLAVQQARLALLEGDRLAARRHFEAAWSQARAQEATLVEVQVLTALVELSPSSELFSDSLRNARGRIESAGADSDLGTLRPTPAGRSRTAPAS